MREKQIENAIKRYLSSKGVWYIKHHANKFTKVGVPDILACWEGKFLAIEVKTPVGKLTELQKYNLEAIQNAGGISLVARSLKDVVEVIDAI